MPDFQSYSLTPLAAGSLANFPRFAIELTINDSNTGEVLFDFTGAANRIVFPNDIPTLYPTAAERLELAHQIARLLIRKKAGQ